MVIEIFDRLTLSFPRKTLCLPSNEEDELQTYCLANYFVAFTVFWDISFNHIENYKALILLSPFYKQR